MGARIAGTNPTLSAINKSIQVNNLQSSKAELYHRAPTLRLRWEVNDVRPWKPIILFLAVVSGERARRTATFAALDMV